MLKRMMALVMGCGALTLGCTQESESPGGRALVAVEPTQEIVENLIEAGFPADDIMVVDGLVYVGRDAVVSLEASREMLAVDPAAGGQEQYRTANLVSGNLSLICVIGKSFTGAFSQALDLAIENYNQQGLSFRMERRSSGNTAGCGATITGSLKGPTGGQSGFPSGGLPFGSFQIGKGTESFGIDVLEHVITHELGHTIGFRHSDFFDRSISCGGSASNEGEGGVGAILIPGTPSGATLGGSVMNSCFRSVESGEWTNSDITALKALY
jgi:Dual-action HEIGH metallo-peptidase